MKRSIAGFIVMAAVLLALAGGCGTIPPTSTTPAPPSPTVTLPPGQEPVEVLFLAGPIPPYNLGGPVVTVKVANTSAATVTSLQATLELNRSFTLTFPVSPSHPLLALTGTSATQTLIGAGFSDNVSYPLAINGTLQGGAAFSYTKKVSISPPAQ